MSKTPPQRRSDTADRILDVAEKLIQTRGYSAFSYNDIAETLQITKASIHYHFKSKADLGKAVIERYSANMATALAAIASDHSRASMEMLDFYFQAYLQFGKSPDRVCLCGALAGEMLALPAVIRECVDQFFTAHQAWLTTILKRGVSRGEFSLTAPAAKLARLIFGALQGALLIKRVTNDGSQLLDIVAAVRAQLTPRAGGAGH